MRLRIGQRVWVAGAEAVVVDVQAGKRRATGREPGYAIARTADGVERLLSLTGHGWSAHRPASAALAASLGGWS